MKINEDIVRYFDGEMSTAEKQQFEALLQKDELLRHRADEYSRFINTLKSVNNTAVDETYFAGIIPRFRKKLTTASRSFYPQIAAAVSAAVVIIAALIIFNRPPEPELNTDFISRYAPEEVDSLLGYYPETYSIPDSVIVNSEAGDIVNNMIIDELKVSPDNLEQVYSYNAGAAEIPNELSTEESDKIYDEIINKRFF